MQHTIERLPHVTKLTAVTEQRFWLSEELARALPTATRDEIILLQEQLQVKLVETVQGALEQVRAAPQQTLERLRCGEPALS